MVAADSQTSQGERGAGRPSVRKQVLRVVLGVVVFPGVLFASAGHVGWPEAWAFLALFFGFGIALRVWLARHDRALVNERLRTAPDVEKWDRVLMAVYSALLVTTLVVTALDAGRFRWSSTPTVVRGLGWCGLAAAMVLVWGALAANPFASRLVRIQHDRGHTVATGGPYRYVRHPMYTGAIIFCTCVPLLLGSWWGLVPGAGVAALFILRTALEDRTLVLKLPGYQAYADRVRYRLFPGIW